MDGVHIKNEDHALLSVQLREFKYMENRSKEIFWYSHPEEKHRIHRTKNKYNPIISSCGYLSTIKISIYFVWSLDKKIPAFICQEGKNRIRPQLLTTASKIYLK